MFHRIAAGLAVAAVAFGCAGGREARATPVAEPLERELPESRSTPEPSARQEREPEPINTGSIPYWEDGRRVGMVSREDAERRGLTVLDLGDDWVPGIFAEDESLGSRGRQPYRARFLALANEEVRGERYLELFGIFPTFHVLSARLADEERHRCHAEIDDAPIEALERALRPNSDARRQRRLANSIRHIRNRLEREARRRRLESFEELASHRRWGREIERMRELEAELASVHAVQAHLRCENLLNSRAQEGVLDSWTARAIRDYQAKHMIISLGAQVDAATRKAMTMDSRELDFLSVLRALRERVAHGGGILEDGTAVGRWGTVVDRRIDLDDEFRWAERLDPLPDGAPDLVSAATDAAARALGWTDPESTAAWLAEHASTRTAQRLVAVRLPPRPDYYSDHMDLRVEIDRGDVWYAFPYTDDGRPRGFRVNKRPLLVMYVRHEGRDIPLIRWNTTIGGWQPEINPAGGVGMRYKESDVGPRVWRDLIASPAWLPPASTPDRELLRRRGGEWVVNDSITGPGYASAFGMAMVIHHLVRGDGSQESDWVDNGIRSHGSVSYRTILRGYSHGCHRLFNHLAVRLTSFLLAHRNHVVHGRIPANFRRELYPPTDDPDAVVQPLTMEITARGYLFELTPPVPVEVLEGNIRGRPKRAPTGFFPLPEDLQAQAREVMANDPNTSAPASP